MTSTRTLVCAGCGVTIARVDATRFAVLPDRSWCLACSHPAWAATRATAPGGSRAAPGPAPSATRHAATTHGGK